MVASAAAQGNEYAKKGIKQVTQHLQQQKAEAAAAAEAAPTPAPPPIPIGTRVELRGLKAKPGLNGSRGVVTGFVASIGRCKVQLDDAADEVTVKPGNMKLL